MFEILFEDEHILLINKPAGVVVNNAKSVSGPTVQSFMQNSVLVNVKPTQYTIPQDFDDQYGTPEEIFAQRVGMVHRLDKDTSGVLLLAKHPGSLIELLAQFKQRTVKKTYLCLTHGEFANTQDTINLPLGRSQRNRKTFAVDVSGRPAQTEYTVTKFYPKEQSDAQILQFLAKNQKVTKDVEKKFRMYQGFSLVACKPKTGRTHQIRVHMAFLQHPLVADQTYVGKKRSKLDTLWCPRQFLHAQELEFTHPVTGEKMQIEAPLTEDLKKVIDILM